MGKEQIPPPPSQGEETWRAGSLSFRGRGTRTEERSPEPRALSGGRAGDLLFHPLSVAHLARCPGAGRRRHRPQVKLPRAPRPDAACLCDPARPFPFAVGLGRLVSDPPEDCRSDGGSSSGGRSSSSSAGDPGGAESNSSPRAPERETPELGDAEGPGGHLAAKQRPVARSKIKVRCRLCPRRHLHHALASGSRGARPSLPRPPAHPGTDAPSTPAARLLHLPLGRRQGASARPPAGRGS